MNVSATFTKLRRCCVTNYLLQLEVDRWWVEALCVPPSPITFVFKCKPIKPSVRPEPGPCILATASSARDEYLNNVYWSLYSDSSDNWKIISGGARAHDRAGARRRCWARCSACARTAGRWCCRWGEALVTRAANGDFARLYNSNTLRRLLNTSAWPLVGPSPL